MAATDQSVNVLALIKGEGEEYYIFLFDDNNRVETLRQIGMFAADRDLSLTWYDAALLSQRIRQLGTQQERHDASTTDGQHFTPRRF